MLDRETAKKQYSIFNNTVHALKEMKLLGYRYYGYLFLDILTQMFVPFCMVLIPSQVIHMFEIKLPLNDMLKLITFWLLTILIVNLIKTFVHQKLENMANIIDTIQYERKINLSLLSCDLMKIEDNKERAMLYEAMQAIRHGDGMGKYAGVIGFYMYGIALCINIGGFILYASFAGGLHPMLLVILLITSLINCIVQNKAIHYQFTHMGAFWDNSERFWYMKNESINTEKAKDIRMYHLYRWFQKALHTNAEEATRLYDGVMNIHFYADSCVSLTSLFRDGLAYLFLIHQLTQGHLNVATFVLYLGIVSGFGYWINEIVQSYTYFARISNEISLFRSYIEYANPKSTTPHETLTITKQCTSIQFDDVQFAYEKDKPIFNHFNLNLKAGEKIALVGINGAGKTTLTKLLCGLYPLSHGTISIDDIDIHSYIKENYYQFISILFQDVHVLPFSIAKNVACQWDDIDLQAYHEDMNHFEMAKGFQNVETQTKPIDIYDEAKVIACLKAVKLWDKVNSLPNGIHTVLTQILSKDGIQLSGGETQRLMLARALYKDAPILILDEPTSALDPIAESELYEEYAKLCAHKISIFISHRLSSTRFCDRILFMDNGRIVEEGTHDELMAKQGKYAEMYQIQSHYYKKEVAKNEASI